MRIRRGDFREIGARKHREETMCPVVRDFDGITNFRNDFGVVDWGQR